MKFLVINGPNLNMLGTRNPEVYGSETLSDIENYITDHFSEHTFEFYQSNVEGELINKLQSCAELGIEAIVANFGAYTHTSVALRDALEAIEIPKIEVHFSNIHAREEFRERSLTGAVVHGIITGFGKQSYILGIQAAEQLSTTS